MKNLWMDNIVYFVSFSMGMHSMGFDNARKYKTKATHLCGMLVTTNNIMHVELDGISCPIKENNP